MLIIQWGIVSINLKFILLILLQGVKSGVGANTGGATWADGTGKPINLGGHLTPADRHGSVQVTNNVSYFKTTIL